MIKLQKKLGIGLLTMVSLSPLGVYLPELFNAEEAWGEWEQRISRKCWGMFLKA